MMEVKYSWIIYHVVLYFLLFEGVAALRCFECNDVFKPYLCDIITTCTTGEECFIEQYVTSSGNVLYKSGCRSTQRCSAAKRELSNLVHDDEVTNDVAYDVASDLVICSQCCNSTDYCNKDGCNQYGTERSKRGPYCFDCRKQGKGSCRHVTQCDLYYACEITTEESNGITLYNSQCVHAPSSKTCNVTNLRLAPSIVGRRDLDSSDNCPKCCDEDFCNEDCIQNTVNGGFSSWSTWSNCDVTCGNNGTQTRTRLCNNQIPSNGGLDCQGAVTDLRACPNLPICQSSSGYTTWSTWSACSVTCGSHGVQYRAKICIAQSQTVQCSNPIQEQQSCCGDQECFAVDGGWDTWHAWSRCLSKCGQGYQHSHNTLYSRLGLRNFKTRLITQDRKMATKGLREPGWTNNLRSVPNISMNDVIKIIQKHSKVPNKHLDKGYKFFHGSYVHNIEVKVNERGCYVRGKCYRSMKKNEAPWTVHISILNSKAIESQSCGCAAGKGSCAHVATLVYQLAHYKTLKMNAVPEIVSKTSQQQQWHVPPRTHGITPRPLSDVKFVKPKASGNSQQCVCSTLYNPLNTEFPDTQFFHGLQHILPMFDNIQLQQVLPDSFDYSNTKETLFGNVLVGSSLCHQLPEPESDGTIIQINNDVIFPSLPLLTHDLTCPYQTVLMQDEQLFFDGISVTLQQAVEIEESTRKQSKCPEWYNLRSKRITSSKFKEITMRKKDFVSLTERLTCKRSVQTQAMKYGLDNEVNAVLEYATHKKVNIKPCGFIINPAAPYIGSSPDRVVFDPNELCPFGVLEVKCPMKDSYKDVLYLKENNDGTFSLKHGHAYYLQVIGQMAISGLTWADFCVWTPNDMHIERIYFDNELWASTLQKLSAYYFDHFIKHFV